MERENTRKPASKAFVLSLFVITIILIILLFFIKISPRGVIDPNAVSIRQDSGEIQYKYADGNWQKIVSLEDLKIWKRAKKGQIVSTSNDILVGGIGIVE